MIKLFPFLNVFPEVVSVFLSLGIKNECLITVLNHIHTEVHRCPPGFLLFSWCLKFHGASSLAGSPDVSCAWVNPEKMRFGMRSYLQNRSWFFTGSQIVPWFIFPSLHPSFLGSFWFWPAWRWEEIAVQNARAAAELGSWKWITSTLVTVPNDFPTNNVHFLHPVKLALKTWFTVGKATKRSSNRDQC